MPQSGDPAFNIDPPAVNDDEPPFRGRDKPDDGMGWITQPRTTRGRNLKGSVPGAYFAGVPGKLDFGTNR